MKATTKTRGDDEGYDKRRRDDEGDDQQRGETMRETTRMRGDDEGDDENEGRRRRKRRKYEDTTTGATKIRGGVFFEGDTIFWTILAKARFLAFDRGAIWAAVLQVRARDARLQAAILQAAGCVGCGIPSALVCKTDVSCNVSCRASPR